MVIISAYFI